MDDIKILFLSSRPTNTIYISYFKFMKILNEKNIEFFLHTDDTNDVLNIFNILQNVIDKKNIITDIQKIKDIKITHVFYKVSYNCCFSTTVFTKNIKKMFSHCKICYYNYGFSMNDHKFLNNVGYNSDFFDDCDYFFIENKLNLKHYQERISNKKLQFFDTGCIKLDTFTEKSRNISLDKFYIMWAPRWHTDNSKYDMCSYKLYVNYFINLINNNKNIILIFRPHPLNSYSISEIKNACEKNPEQIIIDNNDNYYDTFKYINVLISDPSSMIAEAYSFSVPIIYTKKIENAFTEFGNLIENSFYSVKNEKELDLELNHLLKNNDYKKDLRQKYINEYFNIYKEPIKDMIKIIVDQNNIIKIKYFDTVVFHLNKSISIIENKNGEEQSSWGDWTGLTTNRPFLIIEYLTNNKIINNNDNILDIGCGCAEMGVEINRRQYNLNYTGLEINTMLNEINRLNLPKYNFIDFDINFDKIEYENNYNIIMMMGCSEVFSKISLSINSIDDKYKPKYIICETHVNRKENLDSIIELLNNYKVILNYNFDVINNINRQDYAPAYKRLMFILVKV
jgi:hypothetical protein